MSCDWRMLRVASWHSNTMGNLNTIDTREKLAIYSQVGLRSADAGAANP